MQIGILKLLISFVNSKFVLTPQSHISLDWKFQSSLTFAPIFAHATLQLLGSEGDNNLYWHMFCISIIISTILV